MINIDEACSDSSAKYWAIILKDYASEVLLALTAKTPCLRFNGKPLLVYNVHRVDGYKSADEDPFLPQGIKLKLREKKPRVFGKISSGSLEGWHVLRTQFPLAGEELKEALSAIHKALKSDIYSTGKQRLRIEDCIVLESIYEPQVLYRV